MRKLFRTVYLLLAAALIIGGLQFSTGSPVAAQDADPAAIFDEIVAAAAATPPDAGPFGGEIELDQSMSTFESAGVSIADPVIHAEFIVPDVPNGTVWNASVAFRVAGDESQTFIVASTGQWIYIGSGVGNGEGIQMPAAGQTLAIDIVASDTVALFGVGGEFVTVIDIGESTGPGDVTIDASLVSGFGPASNSVTFQNFQVWDFAAATSGTTSTSTDPTPTTETAAVETPAPPTGDDAAIFTQLRGEASSNPIVYGPEAGTMAHTEGEIATFPTDVNVTDFVARVECIAPRAVSEGFWDCGLNFRGTDPGDGFLVVYVSDGTWIFGTLDGEDFLGEGSGLPGNLNPGDKITLNLAVQSDRAYFGVNGDFVEAFDVSSIPGPGTVGVASAFFGDTTILETGIDFEDLVIWSLDSGTQVAVPTEVATEAATEVATEAPVEPTATAGTTSTGVSSGNTYVSPTFGYSLTWDDTWQTTDESSENGRDYFGLDNGSVFVDLIGESWDPSIGTCFDYLVDFYTNNDAYTNINPAAGNPAADGSVTGVISMTYTDPDDGTSSEVINVVLCAPIPGDPNSVVTLEQFVSVLEYAAQANAIDALQAGFELGSGVVAVAETPTAEVAPTESATTGTTGTTGVSGNTYVSPTWGYSVSWDENWTVNREESDEEGDTLVLDSEFGFASLLSESWNTSFDTCFEWLVDFYQNNERYTNVESVANDAMPAPFSSGVISSTFTSQTTGNSTDFVNTAACAPIPGAEDQVVVFEIVVPLADYPNQVAAIAALQSTLTLGTGGAVVEVTPAATESSSTGTSTDTASASFLLNEIGGSGVQGLGSIEGEGRTATVNAVIIGASAGDQLYAVRGTCADLATIAEPDVFIGEINASGLVQEELRVRLSAFAGSAIVVYPAGEDFSAPLACGDVLT